MALRWLTLMAYWGSLFTLVSCGGNGGTSVPVDPPAVVSSNAQALVVDSGPTGLMTSMVNMPYTSVRICIPGTSTCQTIDHVLVDTGSTGLRLLSANVMLTLPGKYVGAKPLYNCVQFIDQSYMWGTVASVDLYMGGDNLDGEKAANLPMQLVGSVGDPMVPSTCAPSGFSAKNTINTLGAKGILGIGHALQDCGSACVTTTTNGYYYVNAGNGTVTGATVPLSEQLQHPVSLFSRDNNGVVISLPSVSSTGVPVVKGALVFGIGTQSNNTPGKVSVMNLDGNGYFTAVLNGRTMTKGFVDSGSNAWFFGTSSYPRCANLVHWYCPPNTVLLRAINSGVNNQISTVDFSISNATSLLSNSTIYAASTLAGPMGDNVSFDFGLPFFYGRDVLSAIDGRDTPLGAGPFVAY